jgi:hypothetical protein
LLVPYFEVGTAPNDGRTTVVSVSNRDDRARLVNVSLWTNLGIQTQSVQLQIASAATATLDLRQLFRQGTVPDRACATGPLTPAERNRIRGLHRGDVVAGEVASYRSAAAGDRIVRGYVTIDTLERCTNGSPASAGYFSGDASSDNVLSGSVTRFAKSGRLIESGPAVHIEAFAIGLGAGAATFYGSLVGDRGTDKREPLPTAYSFAFEAPADTSAGVGPMTVTIWRDIGEAHRTTPFPTTSTDQPAWYTASSKQGLRSRREFRSPLGDIAARADSLPLLGCGVVPLPCDPPASAGLATQHHFILPETGGDPAKEGEFRTPFSRGSATVTLEPWIGSHDIPPNPPPRQGWIQTTARSRQGQITTVAATAVGHVCEP